MFPYSYGEETLAHQETVFICCTMFPQETVFQFLYIIHNYKCLKCYLTSLQNIIHHRWKFMLPNCKETLMYHRGIREYKFPKETNLAFRPCDVSKFGNHNVSNRRRACSCMMCPKETGQWYSWPGAYIPIDINIKNDSSISWGNIVCNKVPREL